MKNKFSTNKKTFFKIFAFALILKRFFNGGLSSGLSQKQFHTNELSEIIKIKEPKAYENIEFLTHLYVKKKWSIRQISKDLGCSKTTVRNRLGEAGIDIIYRKVDVDKALIKKIDRLRRDGFSYQKIADLLNLWKVRTASDEGRWHAKTIRKAFLGA